jgi:adenylate cyclase
MRRMAEQPRSKRVPDEAEFRRVLTGEHPELSKMRRRMGWIPTSPRCKLCKAPFEGLGGAILRHVGYARFAANPSLCVNCIQQFRKAGTFGAEIPVTLLFADVRGSTGIGERMRPAEFRAYLDHFYRAGSEAILGNDGLVDKLVGDEVIGLFFGGVTGPWHQRPAIQAALQLLERVARPDASPAGPIPVGVGVHTGEAYVGTTGPAGAVDDFTALGDVVNATARLASAAAAGELLVSLATVEAAGWEASAAERRHVDIRGRQESIDVLVLGPAAAPATAASVG